MSALGSPYFSGTFASSSFSHVADVTSDGIRHSLLGDRAPPATTFGPLGSAERLNWLAKKRRRKTCIQCRIVSRSYAVRSASGEPAGHPPASLSHHACQAR